MFKFVKVLDVTKNVGEFAFLPSNFRLFGRNKCDTLHTTNRESANFIFVHFNFKLQYTIQNSNLKFKIAIYNLNLQLEIKTYILKYIKCNLILQSAI